MTTVNPYAGYEIVVGIDVSGSMNTKMPEYDGISRLQFVREQIGSLVEQLLPFDDNGIDTIFFGNGIWTKKNVESSNKVNKLFDQVFQENSKIKYGTDTHLVIEECFKLHQEKKKELGSDHKATICLIITDGEPTDETATIKALDKVAGKVKNHAEIALSFLQVGKDEAAGAFLQKLDDLHPPEKDICDTKNFGALMVEGKISLEKVMNDALND